MTRAGIISIITAIHNDAHRSLRESYESLRDQQLPNGWSWEWCIQSIGNSRLPQEMLPDDPRLSVRHDPSGNSCAARTAALSRATGQLTRNLDADDVLLPDALKRDIDALHRVAWCTSGQLVLHRDASMKPAPLAPFGGQMPPSFLLKEHEENRLAAIAKNVAAHTGLVWALGGWTNLPGAETIGLALALEAVTPGEFIAEPSTRRRKFEESTLSDQGWDGDLNQAGVSFAVERAKGLRRLGWRWTPQAISELLAAESTDLTAIPTELRQAAMLARLAGTGPQDMT